MKETETTEINREALANKLWCINQEIRTKFKDLAIDIGSKLESDDVVMPEATMAEIGFMIGEAAGDVYKTVYEYTKELRGY